MDLICLRLTQLQPDLTVERQTRMEKRSHGNSWLQKCLGGCLFMMSISLERKQPSLNHMHGLLEVEYISLEYVYHGVCKTPEVNIATLTAKTDT